MYDEIHLPLPNGAEAMNDGIVARWGGRVWYWLDHEANKIRFSLVPVVIPR